MVLFVFTLCASIKNYDFQQVHLYYDTTQWRIKNEYLTNVNYAKRIHNCARLACRIYTVVLTKTWLSDRRRRKNENLTNANDVCVSKLFQVIYKWIFVKVGENSLSAGYVPIIQNVS